MNYFDINCVEIKKNEYNEEYGCFIFEPLEVGQAVTLGNSLRRVLLSDLPGLAIVGIRIPGINYEFGQLPNIREDILEIILNLKEVVLKGDINQPIVARIKKQGPGLITASCIEVSGISIVNPNQYIGTIMNNEVFEIEIKIQKGKNYELIKSGKLISENNFIPMDAIFMPVTKVHYEVESIQKNGKLSERLIFNLWTNGSITPDKALFSAGDILRKLLEPLSLNQLNNTQLKFKKNKRKLSDIKIEELNLSSRSYNALKRAEIHSIAQLITYSLNDLKEIKNFGSKSIHEVLVALKNLLEINLKLKT